MTEPEQKKIKSCFAALAGRPNVGKSTLLNRIVGAKVAITSPRPQTTRNRIVGILTRPGFQTVFLDTPGVMKEKSRLNRYMTGVSVATGGEADLLLFMTDATRPDIDADLFAMKRRGQKQNAPVFAGQQGRLCSEKRPSANNG